MTRVFVSYPKVGGNQYSVQESKCVMTLFPSQRLVPQGKAAAVGLAFGESLFLRKLLMPVLVTHTIILLRLVLI